MENNNALTTNQIIAQMTADLSAGKIKIIVGDGYRHYTDTLTESIIVPITTPAETAETYRKLVMNAGSISSSATTPLFETLSRVSMFIGQPDTGKTYLAEQIAKDCNISPIFLMCRDSFTLETLLEDFVLIDGKPVFQESLAIKKMSSPTKEKAIIILDEFNTLLTGVMKTWQPLFDETSKTFVYRDKVYEKNLNCKFIVTLNDKDKGISIVPDAILSRCRLKFFPPVPTTTLAKWTGVDLVWINTLFQVYKLLGLLNIFGTRQIRILKGLGNITDIKNHLDGLCKMKNIDSKVLDALQTQQLLNAL